MFNDELTLITNHTTYNSAGDPQRDPEEKTVLCEVRDATRQEFYNYATDLLRPEYVVTMNNFEYEGEKNAIFRNEKYTVTRRYELSRDLVELTLSRKLNERRF